MGLQRFRQSMSLGGEQQGDREGELGESVLWPAVGVAAQLPEVRQPRVGSLDGPSQPEGRCGLGRPRLPVCVCGRIRRRRSRSRPRGPSRRRCHSRGPNAGSPHWPPAPPAAATVGSNSTTSWRLAPSAAQATGMPAPVAQQRPLPAQFGPVNRAFAGAWASAGRLVDRPVHRTRRRGRGPTMRS